MTDGRILFWIADGTGHGAAAALLTTLAKLLFHYGSVEHDTPARLMEAVNHDFRGIFGGRSFMTAMCVAVDPSTGRASIVGAGHPPLLIARRTGATETIASVAPPLGLVESPQLTETIVNLKPGDTFLLYTDGLFGSRKGKESRLSPQFLEKILDHSAPSAETLLGRILAETAPSKAGEALPDDVAALAVRRTALKKFLFIQNLVLLYSERNANQRPCRKPKRKLPNANRIPPS